MNDEHVDSSIDRSNKITLGFLLVVVILMTLGVTAWKSLNKLFSAVERYDGASQILITLDRARLHELSYTRDLTSDASKEALHYMNEALSFASSFDSSETNFNNNLNSIKNELERYRDDFVSYVSLNDHLSSSKKSMVQYAQNSSALIDRLRDLQIDYISADTSLTEKLYLEIINSSNAVSLSNNIYSSALLLNKKHEYLKLRESNDLEQNELQILKSMHNDIHALMALETVYFPEDEVKQLLQLIEEYTHVIESRVDTLENSSTFVRYNKVLKDILKLSSSIKKEFGSINDVSLRKLSSAQKLLSKRVVLSEQIILLAENVNIARQADRDFSLSNDSTLRDDYSFLVMDVLTNIDGDINNIKELVIEQDEKELLLELQPVIRKYNRDFRYVYDISNEISTISKRMVSSAIRIDSILLSMRDARAREMKEARDLASFISFGGAVFVFSIALLGYLVRKSGNELQSLTEGLKRSNDRVSKAAEAKTNFLAMMSHEIRTPMNAIIGMSYLALEGKLSIKERGYVEKVHNSANLLLGIINDVLDFSKIEAGKVVIESIEFSLYKMIDSFSSIIQERAKEKNLELSINIDHKVPRMLVGDPLRIHQILMNLGSNAIKFTDTGSVSIDIDTLEGSGDDIFLKISVKDQGIGMSQSQIENLYTSFTQADSTTTRKYGGTGLGLAITKNLVELMNGTISVTSELGNGSQFNVILPLSCMNMNESKAKTYEKLVLVSDGELDVGGLEAELKKGFFRTVESLSDYRNISDYSKLADIEPILFVFVANSVNDDFLDSLTRCLENLQSSRSSVSILVNNLSEIDLILNFDHSGELFHYNETSVKKGNLLPLLYNSFEKNRFNVFQFKNETFESGTIFGGRVLVVEDNAINQELVIEILSRHSVETVLAVNGIEAIDILESDTEFDVILMDCQMPLLDGYEATRIIKEEMAIDIPVLALTANVLQSDRLKAKASGMDGFINKPIVVDEMIHTLSEWIGSSKFKHVIDEGAGSTNSTVTESNEFGFLKVEGVNLEKGLSISGNKPELFMRLLTNFANQYEDKEIFSDDTEVFQINVHTLKGVAGNLGFESIYELCSKIEDDMPNTNQFQVECLKSELVSLCDLINSQSVIGKSNHYLKFGDNEITEIIDSAKSYNIEAIVTLNGTLGEAIMSELSDEVSNELKAAIKTYDFDKIEQILSARFL